MGKVKMKGGREGKSVVVWSFQTKGYGWGPIQGFIKESKGMRRRKRLSRPYFLRSGAPFSSLCLLSISLAAEFSHFPFFLIPDRLVRENRDEPGRTAGGFPRNFSLISCETKSKKMKVGRSRWHQEQGDIWVSK